MKLYAGIGSRSAPPDMLQLAQLTAERLDERGWTLRSGHAEGMDQAFELGAGAHAEVYLPWPTFERSEPLQADVIFDRPTAEARELASRFHPAWSKLNDGVQALHARNMHQVLGRELDRPVKFVVCWTPEGKAVGGTAQALRLAASRRIPVFNLAIEQHHSRIETWLSQ